MTHRRADNPPGRKPTQLRNRFYHEDSPSWLADSFRGLLTALRLGFHWIDLNFVLTLDGYLVNCHWPRPLLHGWYDPKGLVKPTTPVWRLTLAQVRRLRSRTGGYRIHTAQEMLEHASHDGLTGVEFELKPSPGHDIATQSEALSIVGTAEKAGVQLVVKTLTRPGTTAAAVRRLAPFHRAGATTLLLPRGTRRAPRSCWGVVDHVRGRVVWTGKPKERP